jgi:hypothetical protein
MAVDLEAIRKRVQELSGKGRTSSVQLWKPAPGEYKVRALPWKAAQLADGMPFIERHFYYLGDTPRIVAPPAGAPDPINTLIRKLYSTRDAGDRELANKLRPKMTAYMPIVDRASEDKNVQVWSFNKFVYQRLLGFFTNAEVNPDLVDYMDPLEGIDLLVTIKPSGKKFNGKDVMDTQIDLGRRPCKLSNDPVQAKKWLDSVPNIDDVYPQKTEREIETALNTWLAGGADNTAAADEGTGRGAPAGKDELDKLADEVRAPAKAEKPAEKAPEKVAAKPAARKAAKADADIDAAPAPKTSLDAAFDELMQDKTGDE